ncbi:MAG: cytochrome c biosis protein CcmG, thiol:disulfide interchange protein DsbE [Miltoncostaeaceae bacterium]|jgi:thiol-disulfide isomerase/thioredoxin|nr:cytochrome c biosis protein CcmG, thiol:disulfide interchange protein DsbE [Miltoncostaeaceae bacterium]
MPDHDETRPGRIRRPGGWKLAGAVAAVAALGVVLTVGLVAARDRTRPPPLRLELSSPGEPLPAIHGTDPVTGRPVDLAGFRGRPLVVNLWASWCAPCREEAPAIARFVREQRDVAVVGIDVSDTRSGARRFYRRYGWQHPSISDPNATIAADLGLQGLPTTIFLDAQGRVVGRAVRTITYDDLVSAARQLES